MTTERVIHDLETEIKAGRIRIELVYQGEGKDVFRVCTGEANGSIGFETIAVPRKDMW